MPRTSLFVLTYSTRNALREVYYESDDDGRRIVFVEEAIDGAEPKLAVGTRPPDQWPYADGGLVTTLMEGSTEIRIYATRVNPYARFETGIVANFCDLQLSNYAAFYQGNGLHDIFFAVSTSHGPYETSLDGGPWLASTTNYNGVPIGSEPMGRHLLRVRDALAGCMVTFYFNLSIPDPGDDDNGDPTALPAGAIVLRVRAKAVQTPDGTYFEHTVYYYLPSTRSTGMVRGEDSPQSQAYSRPTNEIIDRWCVDPGQPPFREIQVTHDGTGDVTRTPVDGAEACQIRCTLGLTAAGRTVEGYGIITATISGGQEPVRVSIDDFTSSVVAINDPLQAEFEDLSVGRYTVRAIDALGCTASAVVDLASTYGPRYRLSYDHADEQLTELLLFKRDYTGEVEDVCGQGSPVAISRPGSATDHVFSQTVQGTALDMSLIVDYEGQFEELFSGDERLYRADHFTDGKLDWRGYLPTEQYSVPFLFPPQPISFTAIDGLGSLSEVPFVLATGSVPRGDWTYLDVVLLCLSKCELGLPLHVFGNLYPVGADRTVSYLETVRVDVAGYRDSKGKPWDCGKVLRAVLESPTARLYQEDGAIWLEQLAGLTTGELTYFAYSPTGTSLPLVRRTLLRTILPESSLKWLRAAQVQSARAAVSFVEVVSGIGEPLNQLSSFLPAANATELPGWTGTAPYDLVYQGKDKTPLLRLTSAAPGTPVEAALYVQTPATPPLPLLARNGDITLGLRFKARAYGQAIPDPNDSQSQQEADTSYIGVGIKLGSKWFDQATGTLVDDPIGYTIGFPTNSEVNVYLAASGEFGMAPAPITVRFTQPTRGAAVGPVTVDISDISFTWENGSLDLAENYTDRYILDTRQRVSHRDDGNEVFHLDSANTRRGGTLLDARTRLPTTLWQETPSGQVQELGVWLVGYRGLWQLAPAQTLTGTLRGNLLPGSLLTDPGERRPAVYLITQYDRDVKFNEHRISAVQLLPLAPPPPLQDLPFVIYTELYAPFRSEAGQLLQHETALADG